ncbi:MAG TPA: GNAT family N-acetyltransferase [Nevskiaceae bacterium]|nr:GNAT family N-acetyltransferase [Nevskiaceae bacterium]
MNIRVDPLHDPRVIALLEEHMRDMRSVSPPESCHALDLTGLRKPDVSFWSIWDGDLLAGCGALKTLDATHGEIKSMRTSRTHLRKGIARIMLEHILTEARKRGLHRLSLETGSQAYFDPARRLYEAFGFRECPPFGEYVLDPNSVFMTREL